MRTRRTEGKKQSAGVAIALGVLLSVAVLLAGAAALATMILNETIGLRIGGFVTTAITLLAAFLGSTLAINAAGGEKKAVVAGCTALTLFLILASTNILLFDGVFPEIVGSLAAIIVGGALPLLLVGRKGNRAVRRYKIRSR